MGTLGMVELFLVRTRDIWSPDQSVCLKDRLPQTTIKINWHNMDSQRLDTAQQFLAEYHMVFHEYFSEILRNIDASGTIDSKIFQIEKGKFPSIQVNSK